MTQQTGRSATDRLGSTRSLDRCPRRRGYSLIRALHRTPTSKSLAGLDPREPRLEPRSLVHRGWLPTTPMQSREESFADVGNGVHHPMGGGNLGSRCVTLVLCRGNDLVRLQPSLDSQWQLFLPVERRHLFLMRPPSARNFEAAGQQSSPQRSTAISNSPQPLSSTDACRRLHRWLLLKSGQTCSKQSRLRIPLFPATRAASNVLPPPPTKVNLLHSRSVSGRWHHATSTSGQLRLWSRMMLLSLQRQSAQQTKRQTISPRRRITLSQRPYSLACSAVNQRSRSESS